MPHECNMYITASEIDIVIMCDFASNVHSLKNWKCVLQCFSTWPSIVTPNPEFNNTQKNMCPTIRFYVYKVISCCTLYDKCTFVEKSTCALTFILQPTNSNIIVYSLNEIVLMETFISEFHEKFYITEIKIWLLFFYTYAYLAPNTVGKNSVKPSNSECHFMIWGVGWIMQNLW